MGAGVPVVARMGAGVPVVAPADATGGVRGPASACSGHLGAGWSLVVGRGDAGGAVAGLDFLTMGRREDQLVGVLGRLRFLMGKDG